MIDKREGWNRRKDSEFDYFYFFRFNSYLFSSFLHLLLLVSVKHRMTIRPNPTSFFNWEFLCLQPHFEACFFLTSANKMAHFLPFKIICSYLAAWYSCSNIGPPNSTIQILPLKYCPSFNYKDHWDPGLYTSYYMLSSIT